MHFYSKIISNEFLCILLTGLLVRVFAIGPGDQGSIPGRIIPKTHKQKFKKGT